MNDLMKNKHFIGVIVLMILVQWFLVPGGMIGTVVNLAWLFCVIYAQIKGGVRFKENPEPKDYPMFHVDAIKFTIKNLFKS